MKRPVLGRRDLLNGGGEGRFSFIGYLTVHIISRTEILPVDEPSYIAGLYIDIFIISVSDNVQERIFSGEADKPCVRRLSLPDTDVCCRTQSICLGNDNVLHCRKKVVIGGVFSSGHISSGIEVKILNAANGVPIGAGCQADSAHRRGFQLLPIAFYHICRFLLRGYGVLTYKTTPISRLHIEPSVLFHGQNIYGSAFPQGGDGFRGIIHRFLEINKILCEARIFIHLPEADRLILQRV